MVQQAVMLRLQEQRFRFGSSELSLTAPRFKQDLLATCRTWVDQVFQTGSSVLPGLTPTQVTQLADRFADHVCGNALGDLAKFLQFSGIPFTPGGLPTYSLLFHYPQRGILPNLISMSALGEAITGWYLKGGLGFGKGLRDVARPPGTTIDLLFRRRDGCWCFVSAKSSLSLNSLKAEMAEGAADLLREIVADKQQINLPFLAYSVGVRFVAATSFEVYSLELEG